MPNSIAAAQTASDNQAVLARALLNPVVFAATIDRVDVAETHTAYVFLAGDNAYKIKKAVDLGFLNFRTLASRYFYCAEELRLNRRFAPELYRAVVPITGTYSEPVLNGDGEPIEWAVQMRRFDERDRLDHLLASGRLTTQHIDVLAQKIAGFHAVAERSAHADEFGSAQAIAAPALENFAQIESSPLAAGDLKSLEQLRTWTDTQLSELQDVFSRRKQNGFVRECHGDLHLGNIALVDGVVTLFDCLEFSPALRWIDTLSEVAFAVMDLRHKQRADLAQRLLNGYLEISGDYAGLAVFDFYCVYRALVRAKVACLRVRQVDANAAQQSELAAEFHSYISLAQQFTARSAPALIITHGLSGSGKTWSSQALLETIGALRIRSDVERKRLQSGTALTQTGSAIAQDAYAPAMSARTYQRLQDLAAQIIAAGYTAIVDAAFLQRVPRDSFRRIAQTLHVPFFILDCIADERTLRQRIARRLAANNDASEADNAVLDYQLATQQPLSQDELTDVLTCDATQLAQPGEFWQRVGAAIAAKLGAQWRVEDR